MMKWFSIALVGLMIVSGCRTATVRGFGKVSTGKTSGTVKKKVDSLSATQGRVIDVLDTLASMVMVSEDRLRSLEERAARLERSVDTGRTKKVRTSVAEAIIQYDSALRLVTARDYKNALYILSALETSYSDDPLRGNFLYWQGMCLYQMESYWVAIKKFQAVTEENNSTKTDDALLMTAKTYVMLREDEKAHASLHLLLEQFPESEYIAEARLLLNE